ncbi:MAG: hypothetical protein JXN61_06765 [Sedimentisphaerales bacterium]|nr:hypothetical protein [Sedimentisphaerales bacterium]
MRKLKLGKIALVLFLTVLIWVYADLALDETPPARVAVVKVEESGSEAIWVSFSRQPSVDVKVTLSGPHSAFVALDRQLRSENKKLTFVFDPEQERMTTPPGRALNLLDFLQKAKSLRNLGLKVVACVPESVEVDVVALGKKTLPIECFKEDGQSVKTQSIEPSTVDMFASEGIRSAQVKLSAVEIEQAKQAPLEKTPYIVLAEGLTRSASNPVKIRIPTEQSPLTDYSISPATLSIALSPALREKYTAEVTNLTQVLGPIAIRASAEAKRAYEMQALPHMTLYIYDDDAKKGEVEQGPRRVVYNFPEEFVRKREIELKNPDQPAEAKFKLIQLPPVEFAPAIVE